MLLHYRWWWTFPRNGAIGHPSARPHLHPKHPTLHIQLCLLSCWRQARQVQPRYVKGYRGLTAPGQRGLWGGLRLTWLQGQWPPLLLLHRIVQQLPSRQKHQVSLKATLHLYFATTMAAVSLHQAQQLPGHPSMVPIKQISLEVMFVRRATKSSDFACIRSFTTKQTHATVMCSDKTIDCACL